MRPPEPAFLHLTPWHISVAHFLSATLGLPSRAKAKISSDDQLGQWPSGWMAPRSRATTGTALWGGKGRLEGCYFFPNPLCLSYSAPTAWGEARSRSKWINLDRTRGREDRNRKVPATYQQQEGQESSRRQAQVMCWVTSLLVNKGNKTQLSNALAISKKQGRKKKA